MPKWIYIRTLQPLLLAVASQRNKTSAVEWHMTLVLVVSHLTSVCPAQRLWRIWIFLPIFHFIKLKTVHRGAYLYLFSVWGNGYWNPPFLLSLGDQIIFFQIAYTCISSPWIAQANKEWKHHCHFPTKWHGKLYNARKSLVKMRWTKFVPLEWMGSLIMDPLLFPKGGMPRESFVVCTFPKADNPLSSFSITLKGGNSRVAQTTALLRS